jgi:hypothetical protein
MPYNLSTEASSALASGRMAIAVLIDLYLDGGPLRVWNWPGQLAFPANDALGGAGDVTYQSLFQRMEVTRSIQQTASLQAEPLTVVFDASRAGDDEDLIGQFTDGAWHQRKMRVRVILLDSETFVSPIDPVWEWHGRMDHREFMRQPGQPTQVRLTGEGGLFRIRGRNLRTRSHEDQQRRQSGDLFFREVAQMVAIPISWNRSAPLPTVSVGAPAGDPNQSLAARYPFLFR